MWPAQRKQQEEAQLEAQVPAQEREPAPHRQRVRT